MDDELLERSRRGDVAAQDALVREVAPRLLRLARHLAGDDPWHEDLVEEALYRGLTRLKRLREPVAIDAWFSRILVNLWRDRLRRKRPTEVSIEESHAEATPRDRPERRLEEREVQEIWRVAVASLPPVQRAAIVLRVEEQLTIGEIAAVLESTPDRVKASLYYARQALRTVLARRLGESDA